MLLRSFVAATVCVCLTSPLVLPTDGNAAETVTIRRDEWGVPHIFADSPKGGAFGLGYAQAEDRIADVFVSVRTGMGLMSEAFGKQHVEQDYIMRLCRNQEVAKKTYESSPPELKEIADGFTAGIQAYLDEHPDKVPAHAMKLEPWMVLTVGRAMILRWPLGTIMDDLNAAPKRNAPPMRSNEWAVAPSRSADKVAILLSDPHLTWEGLAVMYEARVHAGPMQTNGFFLAGSPMLGIGHTQHVGWALTTGGPDTSDVYELKIRVQPKPQYEYDGQWRDAQMSFITIPIKDSKPAIRPAFFTHLGPVIGEPDLKNGRAYVGASPYLEQTGLFEQFYRMSMAKNVREVYDALGMNQYNEQNVMIADVNGSIAYVRNGATPIRPDGYDWSAPVPGTTSDTAWKGIHPIDDLVHILDPPQGYMQNCNVSPENMMVGSPLLPDKYKKYIYNVSWDTNNPRSIRIVNLLEADRSVTREDAIAYTMDIHDVQAPRWQHELKSAVAAVGKTHAQDPEFSKAVEAIVNWDGEFTAEATATSLYKFWRLKCGEQIDLAPLAAGKPLDETSRRKMLDLFGGTIKEMQEKYGRWDVAWGELHRVGRGGKLFPVGGCDFRNGNREANHSETLFDVGSADDPDAPGRYIANNGSMAMILMFFHKDGIRSYTCTPWGQSADPASPHYMDQGEKLYSQRKMKETWWSEAEAKAHAASTKVLTVQ